MGVSMSYASVDPVPEPARSTVLAEAAQLNASRDWWSEGIDFFALKGRLVGDTKIFLTGYSVAPGEYVRVDSDDDNFMAVRDVRYILEVLGGWSRTHRITWEITVIDPIGLLTPDGPDQAVLDFLEQAPVETPDPPGSAAFEAKAAEISAKYSSRNAYPSA